MKKYQIGDRVQTIIIKQINIESYNGVDRNIVEDVQKGEIVAWFQSEWGISYDVLLEDKYINRIPEERLIIDIIGQMRKNKK